MSRAGGPADDGDSEMAAALRDPKVTKLMDVCGEHINLVADIAIREASYSDGRLEFLCKQLAERTWNSDDLWRRPLDRALQRRYADCGCSPFGRMVMRSHVISGSIAEGLYGPGRPPIFQTTSDLDIMVEVGPVLWSLPGTEETSPAKDTAVGPAAATPADHSGQHRDPTPRLVIAETEIPGFVLLLQERRDDCPHQERRPLKPVDVTQFFKDYQMTTGKNVAQSSASGPACSFDQFTSKIFTVAEFDEVPCLHVPVWWFSDEFFTRQRRYNWPPKAVLDDIKRFGLHLVAVGAPGSSTEKLQWRLSFSRAEVMIASRVTDLQRCAVVAFKICKTALGEEAKVIKTYFVKTSMLWLCEQTPADDWKNIVQGVLKLLDFLDEAVETGNLPCFFWSRINLLRFAGSAGRKAMKKALGSIRQHLTRLLAHGVCALCPDLQEMLTHSSTGRLSERQVRVCLTRWQVTVSVMNDIRHRKPVLTPDSVLDVLNVLARSYTPTQVIRLARSYWHYMQKGLYQALSVAPVDVASKVRLSSSGGGFDWDAAPLVGLLTEGDLKKILGDPDTVRDWLRRHHQLPKTEQPAGTLPADLRSSRDLCDLLLNTPLLLWVLMKSVPAKWNQYRSTAHLFGIEVQVPSRRKTSSEVLHLLKTEWAPALHTKLGMDQQTAMQMAGEVEKELRQLCDDPETRAEHSRTRHSVPDPWQLRHLASVDRPWGVSPATCPEVRNLWHLMCRVFLRLWALLRQLQYRVFLR